jgi:hypothetical protein
MLKSTLILAFSGLFWPMWILAQNNILMELYQKKVIGESALIYRKCDNYINFDFKQNRNKLIVNDLKFEAINGSIKVLNSQELILRPSEAGEMTLIAKSGDEEINRFTFKVMPIPPAKVFLAQIDDVNANPLDLKDPILVPDKLYIIAKPDQSFANFVPKESVYEVTGVEVTVYEKGRAVAKATFSSGELDMTKLKAKSGTGVQITVNAMLRKKGDGEVESAPITTPYIGFFVK